MLTAPAEAEVAALPRIWAVAVARIARSFAQILPSYAERASSS